MNFKRKSWAALVAAILIAVPAQASLVNLGDGTVWDSTTNLVWLKDWNLNGLGDPDQQGAWANSLVFAGASNWVLPTWEQFTDVRRDGGSYDNFRTIFDHVGEGQTRPYDDFLYWSSTLRGHDQCPGDNRVARADRAPGAAPGQYAIGLWRLGTNCYMDLIDHDNPSAAFQGGVAVRTGGVLPGTVPEPQTLALSLLALAAAALVRRRSRTRTACAALALAACSAWAGSAQAALVNRGGGMIYDSTLDITWLQDFNQAQTSGHDSDGFMAWTDATAWAQGLVFGAYDDWRLPTLTALSSLYSTGLGNVPGQATHTGPFTHLLYEPIGQAAAFWSDETVVFQGRLYATAFVLDAQGSSGGMVPFIGSSITVPGSTRLSAAAVRSGDVARTVPEPQSLALSLLALGIAGLARRRRQRLD